LKPKESGGNIPKAKPKKVRVKVPPREVAVGRPPKPQKVVKSKKGSFPAPRPEVTRPVTPKQTKAIEKRLPIHFTDKRANAKPVKFKYNGGDPLSSLNQSFHVASVVSDKGLRRSAHRRSFATR
jgi:hypothetical protein